jgi:hypothetical protein
MFNDVVPDETTSTSYDDFFPGDISRNRGSCFLFADLFGISLRSILGKAHLKDIWRS